MRLPYIDCAKGVGILCITLMHFCNHFIPEVGCEFMGSFMITIFYITSGWLSSLKGDNKTVSELCRIRWRQLGRPYIYWSAIIIGFDAILCLCRYYSPSILLQDVYKTFFLKGIGTLWFLPALFMGEIIWTYLKDKKTLYVLFVFLTLLYKAFYTYNFVAVSDPSRVFQIIRTPFNAFDNMLMAAIYISIGYFSYNNFKNWRTVHKVWSGLLLFALGFISANYFKIPVIWHLLAPVLGPIGLLLLCQTLCKYFKERFFVFWGKNSLFLMVTHYSIILVIMRICVINVFGIPYNGFVTFISFCVAILLEYIGLILIKKYFPKLVGKII